MLALTMYMRAKHPRKRQNDKMEGREGKEGKGNLYNLEKQRYIDDMLTPLCFEKKKRKNHPNYHILRVLVILGLVVTIV